MTTAAPVTPVRQGKRSYHTASSTETERSKTKGSFICNLISFHFFSFSAFIYTTFTMNTLWFSTALVFPTLFDNSHQCKSATPTTTTTTTTTAPFTPSKYCNDIGNAYFHFFQTIADTNRVRLIIGFFEIWKDQFGIHL